MAMENLEVIDKNFLQAPKSIIKCPKCDSIFIDNNVCESCNYHLDYNPLGDVFGKKSYFYLVSNYLETKNKLFHLFPILENFFETSNKRGFEKKLVFRLESIIRYLSGIRELESYKLYVFEAEQIVEELKKLKYSFDILENKINVLELDHPLYQRLTLSLQRNREINMSPLAYYLLKSVFSLILVAGIIFVLFLTYRL